MERRNKYEELVTGARYAGYETELITLEVCSSRGINPAGFQFLKAPLNSTTREMSELMFKVCKQTIKAFHSIWCSRNNSVK